MQQAQIYGSEPMQVKRTDWHDEVKQRALSQGLSLTGDHWEVIEFVMDVYEHCVECRNARQMSNLLAEEFKNRGGRKHLYRLFPSGPVRQVNDLVDLPDLLYETDPGFGTSY